jgi:hypothetical protein
VSKSLVDKVAEAVLYEGYVLYPYRPSSVKNRHRWTFGGLYPRAYAEGRRGSDAWMAEAQCLVTGDEAASLRVTVRFLHLMNRNTVPGTGTWQEATERSAELGPFTVADLTATRRCQNFEFPALRQVQVAATTVIREQEAVAGSVEMSAERVGPGVFRLTTRISNRTESDGGGAYTRDAALMRSLVSTHAILNVTGGRFVSLTDPPDGLRQAAADCRNTGVWPVLVGDPGQTDTMLASPIILPDYPEIAPESPGDLFDGTEIDEILTLRILTLTDEEKRQAADADPRVEAMLARTESLAREQLMNLHGTTRCLRPVCTEGPHA